MSKLQLYRGEKKLHRWDADLY